MANTKKLGAEIGNDLAQARKLGSEKEREARLLIDQILAQESKAKLPQILENPKVQAWQQVTGVTDSNLKSALTKARAKRRETAVDDPLKIPRRRRKTKNNPHTKDLTSRDSSFGGDQRGMVPNRSLELL